MRVLVLWFFMVSSFFPILGSSWATFLPVYGFGSLFVLWKMGGGGLLLFFGGSLGRASRYGKKHCRILFWRIRAALKKALLDNGKPRFRFQYDPSSYALNFDDGSYHLGDRGFHQSIYIVQSFCYTTTTWIYVFWVESPQNPCWFNHFLFHFIHKSDLLSFFLLDEYGWMFLFFVFCFFLFPSTPQNYIKCSNLITLYLRNNLDVHGQQQHRWWSIWARIKLESH